MKKSLLNGIYIPSRGVLALGVGCVAVAYQSPAQSTNVAEEIAPVVITGSFIPTAETVGAMPVQTLSSSTIQQAGTTDTLLTLKRLVPGFTGGGNYLGNVNNNVSFTGGQGYTGESYVALRNLPTLVLINGQRVANSALSGGQSVDLNSIPLSMIERVEVLKDGASAIYGSDAIGGVINVITKQNYNGTEIGGRVGFPTEGPNSNGMQYDAYIVTGIATEKTKFVAGAQLFNQNALLVKDRTLGSQGIKELGEQNVAPPSYVSPSYAGKVQAGGTSYVLANSPFAEGAPGYNPNIKSPPVYPGQTFSGASAITAYNSHAVANGYVAPDGSGAGPYLPMRSTPVGQGLEAIGYGEASGWPALNTTLLGTTTILDQNRRNFWANFDQQLYKDTVTLYGSFLYADNFAEGQLAPSPVTALNAYNIFVPADNSFNPFGIDLGSGGATTPRVRSRMMEFGNRTFQSYSDFYQFVAGLKGNITPDYGYNVSYNYSRAQQEQQTRNAVNGAGLNQALIPNGEVDTQGRALSMLLDGNGNAVPVYNIFGSQAGANAPETINLLRTTLYSWGQSEMSTAQGVFTGTPFSLPAGKVSFAAGGQYIYESLSLQVDGLTKLGLVPGLNAASDFPGGNRSTAAGFVEVNIPIFSKDQNIPAFYNLELNAAGRYQTFDPGGDAAVPKVGLRWQPLDEQFTLRASYSEGFIAPSIYNLYGPDFQSNPEITLPNGNGQVQTQTRSNPDLNPSNSKQWGGGIVLTPKAIKNLTVSVDYYSVRVDNQPVADAQAVADSLFNLGVASPYAAGFTYADGSRITPTSPQVSVAEWGNALMTWLPNGALNTSGFDFSANYVLPTDKYGRFTFNTVANLIIAYESRTALTKSYYDYAGTYTGLQGLTPKFALNTSLTYDYMDWTYVVGANFLPSISNPGNLFPEYGGTEQGSTLDGSSWTIPSYFTIDMQLGYEFGRTNPSNKWYNGIRLAVGCQNITGQDAPLIPGAIEDNTDKNNYDILGRFVYFQVSKKF